MCVRTADQTFSHLFRNNDKLVGRLQQSQLELVEAVDARIVHHVLQDLAHLL